MHDNTRKLATILTYSGTLPLLLCLAATALHQHAADAATAAGAYAAVIIAFISGIHWTIYLFFPDRCRDNLLITSNVVALSAWGSLLLQTAYATLLVQAACFAALLVVDIRLQKNAVLPAWFYRLRWHATLVVASALLLMAALV